ncbi:hypothetical protein QJQ45_020865 [Haematococcus lacustris]|nr:hypothetical protein QJQ45_020865 [Haematococcus lacustris]
MDLGEFVVKPVKDFAKNSARLVKRCTKPDRKEFWKVCSRTALGFVVMGFIGFFVKLLFIVSVQTHHLTSANPSKGCVYGQQPSNMFACHGRSLSTRSLWEDEQHDGAPYY